jgi:hypothetical protein
LAAAVGFEVAVGEQDLRDLHVVGLKKCLVAVHEAGLADGAAGLKSGEIGGAIADLKGHHAGCGGSAGNYDALVACLDEAGDGGCELLELGVVQRDAVRLGQDAGAEFDDDSFVRCAHRHW